MDPVRKAVVTFFDEHVVETTKDFHIFQPGGVELSVRRSGEDAYVFVTYQGQGIPREIWYNMLVRKPDTLEEAEFLIEVTELANDLSHPSVLRFPRCRPGERYRIDLVRPHEPTPPTRSDNFGAG